MCSNGADSNPEFEWLFADYNQLTDTYKIHKQMYTVHGEEGKTKGCHGVKKSPETSLHGHFSSKKKKKKHGRFVPSIGPWWLESDDDLKTQVMWSPAQAASGHKRGEVKASLCTATMERKFSVCVVAAIQSAGTSGLLVRTTGDGWWQLLVNNLISESSALYLTPFFLPPSISYFESWSFVTCGCLAGFSSAI